MKGSVDKHLKGNIDEDMLEQLVESNMETYNEESYNKLAQANHRVEEVKLKVQDNLNEVVRNQADIEVKFF